MISLRVIFLGASTVFTCSKRPALQAGTVNFPDGVCLIGVQLYFFFFSILGALLTENYSERDWNNC